MKKDKWLKEAYSYYNRKLTLLLDRKKQIEFILKKLRKDMENGKQK